MKKMIIASLVLAPSVFLGGCTVSAANYYPGYNRDYVYSTGYYGYRPVWNTGFGWGNGGGWWGRSRGWGGGAWGGGWGRGGLGGGGWGRGWHR